MESNTLTEAFKDAIRAYSTSEMWYSKVKVDHNDPNSLASALNMAYAQLLTSLQCMGLEDRTLKLKLHAILNKYKITPQQYHGGDLIGNHIKKFTEHAEMICADVYDFLQEIPVNSRRNNISDEDLKSRMDKFQDLLILADWESRRRIY